MNKKLPNTPSNDAIADSRSPFRDSRDGFKRICLLAVGVVLIFLVFEDDVCAQSAASNSDPPRGALFDFSKKPAWLSGKSWFGKTESSNNVRDQAQNRDLQIDDGNRLAQNSQSYGSANSYSNNRQYSGNQIPGDSNQVQNLSQRLGAYDADNQLLNTEVAALQQKLQLANQYNQQLKEQLAGTTGQVQQIFNERQLAAQQITNLQSLLDQANQLLQAGARTAARTESTTNGMSLRKISMTNQPSGPASPARQILTVWPPVERLPNRE